MHWTVQSLEKKGYEIVVDSSSLVEIFHDSWVFENNKYQSLEELLIAT